MKKCSHVGEGLFLILNSECCCIVEGPTPAGFDRFLPAHTVLHLSDNLLLGGNLHSIVAERSQYPELELEGEMD